MKCRDVEYLLVELADGTISAEDRPRIETHLAVCAACTADAALLNETFAALRDEHEDAPPSHYFANLVPRIRKRLVRERNPWHLAVPVWLNTLIAPVTVTAMAVVAVGLFRLFEPSEEYLPLKTFIGQASGDDIVAMVTTESAPFEGDFAPAGSGKLIELIPNAGRMADNMKAAYLADELLQPQTDMTFSNDESTLDELDDDAVSQVLDRLNDGSTL